MSSQRRGAPRTEQPVNQDEEVEWQFDALDLRPVERWLAALPLQAVESAARPTLTTAARPHRRLVDRYLDTEDWRLGRAGLVLRTRRRGRQEEATLKNLRPAGKGGLRRRLEITQPLPGDDVGALEGAGPVGHRVAAVAGNHPLGEVLVVRTRRRPFTLRLGDEEVAELALDDTVIVADGEGKPARLRRVEVEVVGRHVEDLEPVVAGLRSSCGLQPAALSKFEAGLLALGLRIPEPPDLGPVAVDAHSTFGELAFAVLRRQLGVLLAKEPGTRLGEDIEELHDMRVATRRLRAALDLFSPAVPARGAQLRAELAWLGNVLGDVRDLDVQLERLDEMEQWTASWTPADHAAASANPAPAAPPLEQLRTLLEGEREAARHRLLEALDSARWARLATSLETLVRQGPNRRSPEARLPAAVVVPGLVVARHRTVGKAAKRARRSGLQRDYHRLRIRCKRLRYSLEFAAGLYGGRTEPVTRRLAKLQDALGLMQDAEVATNRLFTLATRPQGALTPATVFTMGRVAERYRIDAQRLLAELPRRLKFVQGKPWEELAEHMEHCRERATAPGMADGSPADGPPVDAPAPTPSDTSSTGNGGQPATGTEVAPRPFHAEHAATPPTPALIDPSPPPLTVNGGNPESPAAPDSAG